MQSRLALPCLIFAILCGLLPCQHTFVSAEEAVPVPVPAPAPVPAPNTGVAVPVTGVAPPPVPITVPATETVAVARPFVRRENFGDYTLSWSDEFNAEKLDASVWDCRTDSRFWSAQKAENVSVSGGYLHLKLKKEKVGKMDYTAGGIITKRAFRYGYYEASIKCPPGTGWHTAFSLNQYKSESTGARQEIDVCETDSIDLKAYSVNIQTKKPIHRAFGPRRVKTPDLSGDFHVFGCEFTPQKARYFFDGELVSTLDANEFVHDDMSIWLSCIGAPLSKTFHVDDTALPAEVLVDWVRFYEKTK